MGQLAEALRDPQRRRAIEEGGGDYDYTDGFEMLDDMVALRRAFPDATLLGNDNPLDQRLGFLAYWLRDGNEVVTYFGMTRIALETWPVELAMEGHGDLTRANLLREAIKTDSGRVTVIRLVQQEAEKPRPIPLTGEEHRPSVWERLMADDD